jgi:hypothetical protein
MFHIQDFKIAWSQQAFLHFQQIQEHTSHQAPTWYQEFTTLLEQAVQMNKDPVILEDTVQGWIAYHP